MVDQTYLVAFKPPSQAIQHVIAAMVEVRGEHLVFLSSEGKLAALVLMEIVQSWNVLPCSNVSKTRQPDRLRKERLRER
jgi:hypothetical protein